MIYNIGYGLLVILGCTIIVGMYSAIRGLMCNIAGVKKRTDRLSLTNKYTFRTLHHERRDQYNRDYCYPLIRIGEPVVIYGSSTVIGTYGIVKTNHTDPYRSVYMILTTEGNLEYHNRWEFDRLPAKEGPI